MNCQECRSEASKDQTLYAARFTPHRWAVMVESGVPNEEVVSYLGHSNPSVTRLTYAQFSPDYLRKAAGALDLGLIESASGRGDSKQKQ